MRKSGIAHKWNRVRDYQTRGKCSFVSEYCTSVYHHYNFRRVGYVIYTHPIFFRTTIQAVQTLSGSYFGEKLHIINDNINI